MRVSNIKTIFFLSLSHNNTHTKDKIIESYNCHMINIHLKR